MLDTDPSFRLNRAREDNPPREGARRDRKEVAVHFRSVPHLPFGHGGEALPNVLRFGLDPESLTLDLTGIGARAHTLVPLELTARIDPPELPAYGRLLLDVLTAMPPCRSAATKPNRPGGSSLRCCQPGRRISSRCWSTRPAPRARVARVRRCRICPDRG
jgi:hypothetical protein